MRRNRWHNEFWLQNHHGRSRTGPTKGGCALVHKYEYRHQSLDYFSVNKTLSNGYNRTTINASQFVTN
ncbi:hypothetical protein HanPSC8_Chr09g0391591 [Helianthus annuus]|nr:hypothetical protein HanPSC8_Chr09g0391591 [Helianthus annuus]